MSHPIGTSHLNSTRPDMTPCANCPHPANRHSAHSTRPCLACTACDIPGHDPHVATRCACSSYTPAGRRCEICGTPIDDEAIVCHACALVAPPSVTARHVPTTDRKP